jgi:hypothetical protein
VVFDIRKTQIALNRMLEIWTLKEVLVRPQNESRKIFKTERGNPCYIVAQNMVELCPTIDYEAEFVSNKVRN